MNPIFRPSVPSGSARRADRVIVKLKTDRPGRARFAAALRGEGQPTLLGSLVESGRVQSATPIFPPSPASASALGQPAPRAAFLAAALEEAPKRKASAGLVSLRLDRSTDAAALAHHLSAMKDEIEYAYIPPLRRLLAPAARRARAAAATGDPFLGRQWAHSAIRVGPARASAGFVEATQIVVAVVDSGVDDTHPDLQGAFHSYDNYVSAEDKRDRVGHGTHVSGIIAAVRNNGIGVEGICAAPIMAVKALPLNNDDYQAEEYYRALAHPIDHGARVINLSLGGGFDPAERDIIADAIDAGLVVVAAMGNEYQSGNPIEYPAAFDNVIAVGASDEADRRCSFSNTGPHISLMAPGARILSTTPTYPSKFAQNLDYDSWDGTSMATPHVAAAAALILAKNPALTPKRVRDILASTADPAPGQSGRRDDQRGSGRLNLAAALGAV